jgi:hypothetical protein
MLPRSWSTNARSGTPDTPLIPYIVPAKAKAPKQQRDGESDHPDVRDDAHGIHDPVVVYRHHVAAHPVVVVGESIPSSSWEGRDRLRQSAKAAEVKALEVILIDSRHGGSVLFGRERFPAGVEIGFRQAGADAPRSQQTEVVIP